MNGNSAHHHTDAPSELPAAIRRRLADVLRSELATAYAAALANGATPEQLAEFVTERRALLRSMLGDAAVPDDGENRVDDPRRPLRVVEHD